MIHFPSTTRTYLLLTFHHITSIPRTPQPIHLICALSWRRNANCLTVIGPHRQLFTSSLVPAFQPPVFIITTFRLLANYFPATHPRTTKPKGLTNPHPKRASRSVEFCFCFCFCFFFCSGCGIKASLFACLLLGGHARTRPGKQEALVPYQHT